MTWRTPGQDSSRYTYERYIAAAEVGLGAKNPASLGRKWAVWFRHAIDATVAGLRMISRAQVRWA
jgi:hypothetical protein